MAPIPRTLKTVTLSALVAGTVALAAVQPASASGPVAERYAGRAGAQVVDLSLLGRRAVFGSAMTDSSLEAVGRRLDVTATGTGTDLSPATRSVARFGDTTAPGGTRCAEVPLGAGVAGASQGMAAADAGAVPGIEVAPACGGANITGTPGAFTAESVGGRTVVTVKLPDALQPLVDEATAQLAPQALSTPVADLVSGSMPATPEVTDAVGTLNGVLGSVVPGVALPAMEPNQTVGDLLHRLGTGDLLRIDLGSATAHNGADAGAYLAQALSEGGVIDVLPGFRGAGSAPLLRLAIARSRAAVPVDRTSMQAAPSVDNAVVRVESDVLANLPFAGPPVVNGLVHGTPLSALPGGTLPVNDGLLGGGLPLDRLVAGLGLRSGTGFVEIGPGQSLSFLCDGPTAALCSEVSVSAAKAPVTLPDGVTRAESSTVTVHLFKKLDNLVPGSKLGTALALPAADEALGTAAPADVVLGNPTGIAGIRLVSGGAVAEAGGARVLGAEALQAPTPAGPDAPAPGPVPEPGRNLPHTGGQPFSPGTAPALLAAGLALGGLLGARRR